MSKKITSFEEREADKALAQALQALTKATELASRAGYGHEVLIPLGDAQKNVSYALNIAIEK
jgi:hypothetical protein